MADHDVVIVGAGISGIGAAYNLKKAVLPNLLPYLREERT